MIIFLLVLIVLGVLSLFPDGRLILLGFGFLVLLAIVIGVIALVCGWIFSSPENTISFFRIPFIMLLMIIPYGVYSLFNKYL